MSSLETNKIVGAVLVAGMALLVTHIVADKLVEPHAIHAAAVTVPEGQSGGTTEPAAPAAVEPVSGLLAAADPAKGAELFKKCGACHTAEKGGDAKVGPNLWGIVGNKHAHMEGYAYSDAMKAMADHEWTYEELNAFLASPKTHIPGTKMTFPGLKKVEDRASVIAYLRTMADSPVPLPDQAAIDAATAAAAAAAPATTEAAAAEPATDAAAATPEPAAASTAAEPAAAATQTAAAPAAGDLAALLAAADPAQGQTVAKKCAACHNFEKGGPNKVGPNLWDIVGAKHAHKDDYSYSDAIKGMADKEWSYAELDAFLTAPKAYAPGTKMTFPGIKKPEDRAAVIAYLRSLSDSPKPLP
ncbi:MAG TPA: cytochrome c family protein [Verrucomicrobiae bacterium]|nr:cytochrome c family protein [Verrucomicrobiae bacterium]